MSATKEFLAIWLQENVGNLPAESEVSIAILAQQFEQDADAAGYGREVRDDELGNIENAIAQVLKTEPSEVDLTKVPLSESEPPLMMEALEVDDPKSGP